MSANLSRPGSACYLGCTSASCKVPMSMSCLHCSFAAARCCVTAVLSSCGKAQHVAAAVWHGLHAVRMRTWSTGQHCPVRGGVYCLYGCQDACVGAGHLLCVWADGVGQDIHHAASASPGSCRHLQVATRLCQPLPLFCASSQAFHFTVRVASTAANIMLRPCAQLLRCDCPCMLSKSWCLYVYDLA